MYAVVIIRYRVPLEEVLKVQDAHRTYLRGLKAAGTILASGAMEPRTGGILLVRVPDDNPAAALETIRDNDPFWKNGIGNYELVGWNPSIGRDDLDKL